MSALRQCLHRRLVVAAAAFAAIAGAAIAAPDVAAPATDDVPANDLPAMMRSAAANWVHSQLPDGSIPYGWDFLADRSAGPSSQPWQYVVRQAGAFFFLADYFEHTHDAAVREPLQRGLRAIGAHSLPLGKARAQEWLEGTRLLSLPVGRWKLQSALDAAGWLYRAEGSGRVVSPDRAYATALTGATGVALLAELAYSRATGDEAFAALRAGWRDALVDLHIPGGGFRETPASIEESDYSNGEAWLALARYVDRFTDARAGAVVADVDAALIDRYTRGPNAQFFHWGAQAAAQRWRTTRDPRFLAFLRTQGDAFLHRFKPRLRADDNNCASMEGVATIVGALTAAGEGDRAIATGLRAWLAGEARKLPRLQVHAGQVGMTLGGDARLVAPRLAGFEGALLEGLYSPVTRVDATGHCLAAMVIMDRERLAARAP